MLGAARLSQLSCYLLHAGPTFRSFTGSLLLRPVKSLAPCADLTRTLPATGTLLGSEEARLRAGLRPPPKLPVHISCRQLSRRLSNAEMQEKELSRSTEQARTRRKVWSQAAVSSRDCANAGTDATKCVAGSSRRDVGRACGRGRVCYT